MKNIRLLLIGVDYFPESNTGDKKFFINLLNLLKPEVESITIASIIYKRKNVSPKSSAIPIHYIRSFYNDYRINSQWKVMFGSFERTITFLKALNEIKKIIKDNSVNIVHFIDNFGPLTFLVKKSIPSVYTTGSAIGSVGSGFIFESGFKLSLNKLDKIITYSDAMRLKLTNLGIKSDKLKTIRWGVQISTSKNKSERSVIKNKFNIPTEAKVILWSGFLQQTNYKDFLRSLEIAKQVINLNKSCHFIFAFKPEHFKLEYLNYESDNIIIKSNVNIKDLFDISDLLLSPISLKNTIVAPPLTWLEAMSCGVPVISTKVGGIEEVISNDSNGFVAEIKDIPAVINYYLNNNMTSIKTNARKIVCEKYNVEHSAREYLNLWESMIDA